jgi:hypothetical protein
VEIFMEAQGAQQDQDLRLEGAAWNYPFEVNPF